MEKNRASRARDTILVLAIMNPVRKSSVWKGAIDLRQDGSRVLWNADNGLGLTSLVILIKECSGYLRKDVPLVMSVK